MCELGGAGCTHTLVGCGSTTTCRQSPAGARARGPVQETPPQHVGDTGSDGTRPPALPCEPASPLASCQVCRTSVTAAHRSLLCLGSFTSCHRREWHRDRGQETRVRAQTGAVHLSVPAAAFERVSPAPVLLSVACTPPRLWPADTPRITWATCDKHASQGPPAPPTKRSQPHTERRKQTRGLWRRGRKVQDLRGSGARPGAVARAPGFPTRPDAWPRHAAAPTLQRGSLAGAGAAAASVTGSSVSASLTAQAERSPGCSRHRRSEERDAAAGWSQERPPRSRDLTLRRP